jgi:hypothetical protein
MNELTREELLGLLTAYDRYIQEANDENRYADGWYPVCISEFYENEFQLLDDEQDFEPEL